MRKCLLAYSPGIILFIIAFIIGLLTCKDYGISWDEPVQRHFGVLSYDYIFEHNNDLLSKGVDHHGTGFELLLVLFEKWMRITDSRGLYFMRHLMSHLFFLFGCLASYILAFRLFSNKFIASLGFIMIWLAPRIYAHSFFNSKDVPILTMFIIIMMVCQIAFEKNKTLLFLIGGILCGFGTSIRITGIMLGVFIFLFLLIDLITSINRKERTIKPALNLLLFLVGFCFSLYLWWPYLWTSPIHNFINSCRAMSHYNYAGETLFDGKMIAAERLPYSYFPIWFLITNPLIWLIAGFAGILWMIVDFFRMPLPFIKNTPERNFLLFLLCFTSPVIALFLMHSVIYDDWRHLYFIYPPFVFIALYFINKMIQTRFSLIVKFLCMLQIGFISYFMIKNHPFQQVYFNNLVSHKEEYLRKNYDMEYWGCSFKQALDHLIAKVPVGIIKVCSDNEPALDYNLLFLTERNRSRFEVDGAAKADYFITDFRGHPDDYTFPKVEYSIKVLNSTILCIYKIR